MKNVLIILSLFLLVSTAKAEQRNIVSGNIVLSHDILNADQLPFPGTPVKISVAIENTKNSQLVLKGFFVRDGKLLEQNLSDFSTNDSDQLVYSTSINAPLAELTYQFVLLNGQTPVAQSKRYVVRRKCMPNIESLPGKIPEDTIMKDKLKTLQLQATNIQSEVQNYETALRLLDELKVLTEK